MNDNYKVLAVNDNFDQLNLLETLLRQAGYRVLTADSGNKAFQIARRELPDLIISDVMMPDGDGVELSRLIRDEKTTLFTPILLLSAVHKDTKSIVHGIDSGADDYLQVPYEPMHLIAKVARLIERKRMNDALRESENRFRNLIENLTDVISILDSDGKIIYESPSLKNVLGYEPDELIGKNAFDFIHPEDFTKVIAYFRRAIEQPGNAQSINYRYRHKDRSWRILQSVGKAFSDPVNGLVAIINSRDITEQVQAQEFLLKSEERFQLASRATNDMLWDWDLLTDSLWLSDAFYHQFGYERIKVNENMQFWHELVHPDDKDGIYNSLKFAIDNQDNSWSAEYRFRRSDGSYGYVFDRGYVMYGENGAPLRMIGAMMDFSERKQAQEHLDLFFNVSVDMLCFASFDGYFKRLNPAWERVLGFTQEELLAKPYLDLVHPDDREHTIKESQKNLAGEKTISFENRYLCKDGSYKWLSWNAATITGQQMVYAVAHDITERKNVEAAIRFQADLLNTVEQAVIATDLDGIVIYWNRFAQKLYGWSAGEAVGRNIMNLTAPNVSHTNAAEIMSRLSEGNSWSGEFLTQNKDGKVFPANVSNSPIHDSNGKLIGIVGISFDISERKETEQAIAEANKRAIREYDFLLQKLTTLAQTAGAARDLQTVFRAILEFAQASVPCTGFFISLYNSEKQHRTPAYAWDSGSGEFEISSLPPMAMSNSPHSRAIMTGEIIIEDDFQAAMTGQPVVNIGLEKNPDLPQSCLVVPMAFMGRIVGAVEVQSTKLASYTKEHATAMRMAANLAAIAIENVRLLEQERVRAEQLRQSQKLESVGRLAGGIAHDFNNMLTAINGYSGLILRQLESNNPLRPKVEEIKKAGERSASLTNQLLAFSRQQVLKPKVLDINEVIIDTSKMLQRLIGEDIQLNLIPNRKIGQVEVDPGQLAQVIMNLAVNARDAMPDGGNLTIETANVYLDEKYAALHIPTKPGSYVMLAVSDSGVGMNDETLQHIFEPFYTTKEVGKGTGLGLATVYGIVKQSSGYIWVYSEVDKGTTFKIYFPRVDVEVYDDTTADNFEDIPGGNETILLAEDEDTVRNLTRQILESCGYRVIEARNGTEALSVYQNLGSEIDLLITDVVMPKMGGRELSENLNKINPHIRHLYMSGYTDDAIIRQGMITADMNFIQKPFTFEALAQKVRQLLDEKKSSSVVF